MAYCSFEIKGKAPLSQIFTNSRFFTVGLLQMANAEAELRLECGGLAAGAAEQQA